MSASAVFLRYILTLQYGEHEPSVGLFETTESSATSSCGPFRGCRFERYIANPARDGRLPSPCHRGRSLLLKRLIVSPEAEWNLFFIDHAGESSIDE